MINGVELEGKLYSRWGSSNSNKLSFFDNVVINFPSNTNSNKLYS